MRAVEEERGGGARKNHTENPIPRVFIPDGPQSSRFLNAINSARKARNYADSGGQFTRSPANFIIHVSAFMDEHQLIAGI